MYIKHSLLALVAIATTSTAWGGNESTVPQSNPMIAHVVSCHRDYAVKHAYSMATPTEIAIAAMSSCRKEMEEAADVAYQRALSIGQSLNNAREIRKNFNEVMKEQAHGFVIRTVIEQRSQASDGGG